MKATLVLTQDQLNVISEALNELPFKKAAPVISSIQLQLRATQLKAAEDAKPKTAAAAANDPEPAPTPEAAE